MYDSQDRLRGLQGAPDIDYEIDAQGRRVGKRLDGDLAKQYVWSGRLRIAAEVDDTGDVVSRFIYGNSVTTPDLIVRRATSGAAPDRLCRVIADHLGSPIYVVNLADPSSFECMVEALDGDPALSLIPSRQTGSDVSFEELHSGFHGGMSYGFVAPSNQVIVYLGEVGEAPIQRKRRQLELRRDEIASRLMEHCGIGIRSEQSACHASGLFATFCR